MEPKTRAIVVVSVVVISLLIAVVFRIKNDRKRKALAISSAEQGKSPHFDKNEAQGKKPNLWGIPSWGLALLTAILAFVFLMILADFLNAIFDIPESDIGDLVFYILYNLIIAGGCLYICRLYPGSIWYVPVLCNIIGIMSAIIEPNFWKSSLWIIICSGWLLSIIASFAGVYLGKKKAVSSD